VPKALWTARKIVAKNNEKRLGSVVKELQARCQGYLQEKNQITEIIKTKFSDLETKLVNKIEETINPKTTTDLEEIPTRSYAEMTKSNNDLNITNIKRLLRSEKVEEQIEEQRKQSRDANIIIHGVKETENEKDFVAELLSDVNINTKPTYVSRIGKESGVRPIKVVFKDTPFKYRFMKQLRELKQHPSVWLKMMRY